MAVRLVAAVVLAIACSSCALFGGKHDAKSGDASGEASGDVVMVNEEVVQKPELVNTDPHGAGWLLQIKLTRTLELNGLMSAKDYDDFTASESKDEAVGP